MITERFEFSNENFGTLHHKLDNLPRIVFDLLRKLEQQPEHNQPAPLFRMVAVELRQEIKTVAWTARTSGIRRSPALPDWSSGPRHHQNLSSRRRHHTVPAPGLCKPPPLIEQVAAPVGGLNLVADRMSERHLGDFVREIRAFCAPIPERRPKTVDRQIAAL